MIKIGLKTKWVSLSLFDVVQIYFQDWVNHIPVFFYLFGILLQKIISYWKNIKNIYLVLLLRTLCVEQIHVHGMDSPNCFTFWTP